MSVQHIELGEVTSTNTFLASYRPAEPADIVVATADHQTAGRGQSGNHWESAAGENLLFSLLLHPTFLSAQHLFALSEVIALSIREAVLRHVPAAVVKWPNDIYVGDRKLAGILIENELGGQHIRRAILGCGVNVNQLHFLFPEADTAHACARHQTPTPVSLRQLTGHTVGRAQLLDAIVAAFSRRYEALRRNTPEALRALHAEYLAALYRRTRLHPYLDLTAQEATPTPFLAEIADVEPTGHLLLRDADGRLRRFAFKEVAYIRDVAHSGESEFP